MKGEDGQGLRYDQGPYPNPIFEFQRRVAYGGGAFVGGGAWFIAGLLAWKGFTPWFWLPMTFLGILAIAAIGLYFKREASPTSFRLGPQGFLVFLGSRTRPVQREVDWEDVLRVSRSPSGGFTVFFASNAGDPILRSEFARQARPSYKYSRREKSLEISKTLWQAVEPKLSAASKVLVSMKPPHGMD